jgi:hypothetical protein
MKSANYPTQFSVCMKFNNNTVKYFILDNSRLFRSLQVGDVQSQYIVVSSPVGYQTNVGYLFRGEFITSKSSLVILNNFLLKLKLPESLHTVERHEGIITTDHFCIVIFLSQLGSSIPNITIVRTTS